MSDFEFTQEQMAAAISGFHQASDSLRANINLLQTEYQDAIAQGLAGKNVAALENLYNNGIRPTCLDIVKNLGTMGEQLLKSQNTYNNNFDDQAAAAIARLSPSTGGAGPLSQTLAA